MRLLPGAALYFLRIAFKSPSLTVNCKKECVRFVWNKNINE
jgi:hypothetical protein